MWESDVTHHDGIGHGQPLYSAGLAPSWLTLLMEQDAATLMLISFFEQQLIEWKISHFFQIEEIISNVGLWCHAPWWNWTRPTSFFCGARTQLSNIIDGPRCCNPFVWSPCLSNNLSMKDITYFSDWQNHFPYGTLMSRTMMELDPADLFFLRGSHPVE